MFKDTYSKHLFKGKSIQLTIQTIAKTSNISSNIKQIKRKSSQTSFKGVIQKLTSKCSKTFRETFPCRNDNHTYSTNFKAIKCIGAPNINSKTPNNTSKQFDQILYFNKKRLILIKNCLKVLTF